MNGYRQCSQTEILNNIMSSFSLNLIKDSTQSYLILQQVLFGFVINWRANSKIYAKMQITQNSQSNCREHRVRKLVPPAFKICQKAPVNEDRRVLAKEQPYGLWNSTESRNRFTHRWSTDFKPMCQSTLNGGETLIYKNG